MGELPGKVQSDLERRALKSKSEDVEEIRKDTEKLEEKILRQACEDT